MGGRAPGARPRNVNRFVLVVLSSCLIVLVGCSGGSSAAAPEHQPAPEAGASGSASCPEGLDSFEPGDSALGGAKGLEAELITTDPPEAARFRNVWTLAFRFPDGAAAEDVRVTSLETFMPVHGHPGQPEPTVTWDGNRLRTELYFTMRGPWEVRLAVASEGAGSERFVFDVCVRE